MNVSYLLHHVAGIEKEIAERQLDAIVLGLGPSGWLLPWVDRKLLLNVRVFGAHDVFRIWPVDDLLLFDSPHVSKRIAPHTEALKITLDSRPKRIWIYDGNAQDWLDLLHPPVKSVAEVKRWFVWHHPKLQPGEEHPKGFDLEGKPAIHTALVSPLGATTLAWELGCRRIGVLGVDMGRDHITHQWTKQVNEAFTRCAQQAHERGGVVCNLSPISHLRGFRAWTPSASSSAPTAGSRKPAPNSSLSTASASAPSAP